MTRHNLIDSCAKIDTLDKMTLDRDVFTPYRLGNTSIGVTVNTIRVIIQYYFMY